MRNLTSTASPDVVRRFPKGENNSASATALPIPSRSGFSRFRVSDFCRLALLLAMVHLGTACRTTATRQVSNPQPAIARLQAGGSIRMEVDNLVKPLLDSGEVYGMVVGVVTPDGVAQTFHYGRTGRPNDPSPPDADSLFQIGSVSKLFVTATLERLVEEGRLHYDDTVRSILPTNVPVSAEAGRLTLYDLVTHTSGLPREPMTPTQLRFFLGYLMTGHNLYGHLTLPYLHWYLQHCHPKPGEPRQFVYSNIGAGLLGYLMGTKIGQPVTELVVEKICLPLGMSNSVFTLDASQQQKLVVGHVGNQACWKPADSPIAPWDMGDVMGPVIGMYSTVNDLLIFARANLGMLHHPLEPTLAATHQVQIETPRGGEALGWIINRFDNGRRTITFKDGMASGYCSYIGMDLDARVAVVVLSNKFNWDDKVGHNLLLRLAGAYASARIQSVPGQ